MGYPTRASINASQERVDFPMTSFLLKIIVCPLGVILAAYALPNVEYGAYYQPILVGVALAVVGVIMEYVLLHRGTLWVSTLMDFAVTAIVVYYASNSMDGAAVTFMGAVWTSVLLTIVEYFLHLWLIRSGRTRKRPV
jgi:uncharacterized membrane protein YvlD (DUF360 family)